MRETGWGSAPGADCAAATLESAFVIVVTEAKHYRGYIRPQFSLICGTPGLQKVTFSREHMTQPECRGKQPMAIVTGASSGIGRALAVELARRGYDLCLVARRKTLLEELGSELMRDHGVKTGALELDLTQPCSLAEIREYLHARNWEPDVLVNNAGIGNTGEFLGTDWEREREMLQLNIVALTELTKIVVPGMKMRQYGRILNVASTAAFSPGPYCAVYAATKSYVLSFSQALNCELAGTGVSVSCLCPGPTRTEFAERAGIRDSGRFYRMRAMSPSAVARLGVRALLAGKSVAIPGSCNIAAALAIRLVPRSMVMQFSGAIHRSKAH